MLNRRSLLSSVGGVIVAMGLVVVAGWYLRLTAVVQVDPSFAPMQFNTALGLVLTGVGLIALGTGRLRLVAGCCVAVGLLGGLTAIEYMIGRSLGIDTLLVDPFTTAATSHAGRMSPNTAFSFLLVAASLVLAARPKTPRSVVWVGVLSSVVLVLSVTALAAYVFGIGSTLGWGGFTRMAVHTAFAFALVSGATLADAWLYAVDTGTSDPSLPAWLPVLSGLAIVAASVLVSQTLRDDQRDRILEIVETQASQVGDELRSRLSAQTLAIERMAHRWEFGTSRDAWEADALLHLTHEVANEAIAWVDSSLAVRWIVWAEPRERLTGLEPGTGQLLLATLESARDRGEIRAASFEWAGEARFVAFSPIYVGDRFDGWIASLSRTGPLLDSVLAHTDRSVGITVIDGDKEVYTRGTREASESNWMRETEIDLFGVAWRVRVQAGEQVLSPAHLQLPFFVFVIGAALGVLVGVTLHLSQRAARDGAIAREAAAQLSSIAESALDAVITMEADGVVTGWNPQAERVFGWTPAEAVGRPLDELIVPESLRERHRRGLARFLETGVSAILGRRIEMTGRHRDGHEFPIELSVTSVWHRGRRLFHGFARDISSRKEDENAIAERAEALARTNQELERFARLAVGREQRMVELKREVNSLITERGDPPRYDVRDTKLSAVESDES